MFFCHRNYVSISNKISLYTTTDQNSRISSRTRQLSSIYAITKHHYCNFYIKKVNSCRELWKLGLLHGTNIDELIWPWCLKGSSIRLWRFLYFIRVISHVYVSFRVRTCSGKLAVTDKVSIQLLTAIIVLNIQIRPHQICLKSIRKNDPQTRLFFCSDTPGRIDSRRYSIAE